MKPVIDKGRGEERYRSVRDRNLHVALTDGPNGKIRSANPAHEGSGFYDAMVFSGEFLNLGAEGACYQAKLGPSFLFQETVDGGLRVWA